MLTNHLNFLAQTVLMTASGVIIAMAAQTRGVDK